MKYINIKQMFMIMAALCVCLSSCNDYLDVTPDNRTEIDSAEKVSQLLASAYPQANYAVMLATRCDYVVEKTQGYENDFINNGFTWNDVPSVSVDTPIYFWNSAYFSIAKANHALDAVKSLSEQEQKAASPYIGEAHLIRAFSHFLIAGLYSHYFTDTPQSMQGVPYVDEPETIVIKEYDRGTVASVKEKIETDLLEGLSLMGSDAVYKVPRFHFNNKAANAFATRFFLYEGKWANVVEYASKVIPVPSKFTQDGNVSADDDAYVFVDNNFQPWTGHFAEVPSPQDILAYYTKSSNPSNLLLTEMISNWGMYHSAMKFGMDKKTDSEMFAKTVAGASLGYRIFATDLHSYIPKFQRHFKKIDANSSSNVAFITFPYFRVEEVLLSRAEAYAMLGQTQNAINDINMFMRKLIKNYNESTNLVTEEKLLSFYDEQINDPENYLNKYNAYNISSMEDIQKALVLCILSLRTQEFSNEGLRYWDLMRYRIPVTHTKADGDSNTLYPGDDRWILQLPEEVVLSGVELNPRSNLLSKEW